MTVPDTPPLPTPSTMPRHIDSKLRPPIRHASRRWVIVETLRGTEPPAVIVDGSYRRNFANLNRVTIATSAAVARRLRPLIERCTSSASAQSEEIGLPSGATVEIRAIPAFGPTGAVFGVGLWAGPPNTHRLPLPTVAAAEWNRRTGTAALSSELSRQLELGPAEDPRSTPLPRLMSCFDRWDDREGFLSLFDPDDPTDSWVGTATTQFPSSTRQHLYIAAKPAPDKSTVRAIVSNLPEVDSAPAPDYISAALRTLPLLPGHAFGIVDLKSSLIHEWIAPSHNVASQRHQPPRIHPDDGSAIAMSRRQLLDRNPRTTSLLRIRFAHEEWLTVRAQWTLICHGQRPQALIDIALRHG
ncbi:GAF domain-containing protein [Nocardia transvalensis]|uniref:GAF domain-containing protein n=1 Tax=Nocardia transvalensis TaxID=37333 RepID=UPI001895147D|nr:GAF domain-containing protein [Nocardia transvalensis]MBF6332468.1 DUF5593 domain-containing protein [Nocardia transvalensis]